MTSTITIGTAQSQPGTIVYGRFEAVPHPTGGMDYFPVIIAQGHNPNGPVLWVTANIHGGEFNGIAVIHRLLNDNLIDQLTGTIVAIPSLNPAGLQTSERSPYYLHGKDPNRLFPGAPDLERHAIPTTPLALEIAYASLFERIDATADYLIDLHDYGIQSIPFVIRDPVFYREPRDRAVAAKLQDAVGEMLGAMGLTIVNEYASKRYIEMNLHRSVSGATLNRARIPAVTLEIGGHRQINDHNVQAVVTGIRNVMHWAGMLPGEREAIPAEVPVITLPFPVRRATHPRVPVACMIHRLVSPGDHVLPGDPVARMVDIYGQPVTTDGGLLRSDHEGFVIGTFAGIAFYPNEAVFGMAIRDHNSLVMQVPRW